MDMIEEMLEGKPSKERAQDSIELLLAGEPEKTKETTKEEDSVPGPGAMYPTMRQLKDLGQGVGTGLLDVPYSLARPFGADIEARNNSINAEYKDHPWFEGGRALGEITGVAAPLYYAGGALAPVMAAAGPAGEFLAGKGGMNMLTRALSRSALGAGQGAATTALTSAGSNQPFSKQLVDNTELGAGVMAGFPAVRSVAEKAWDWGKNMFRSPAEYAKNKVYQNLLRDTGSLKEAENRLTQLGPQASLMDVGPNTMGAGRAAANTQGPGKSKIANFLEERQEAQGDRLLDALHKGLGTKGTYAEATDQLISNRAEKAKPLYEQAFKANPAMESPVINQILKTPAGKQALSEARQKMANARSLMSTPDPDLTDAAAEAGIKTGKGVGKGFKLRTLDYVKRSLYDQEESLRRAGKNDAASSVADLRRGLTGEMDKLDVTAKAGPNSVKPEGGLYAQARKSFETPSQSLDALEMGRQFVREDADMTAKQLSKMSDDDKQFFRLGAVQAMKDVINNTADGGNVVKNLFGKKAKREALEAVFPDKQSFQDFENVANSEAQMYNTYAQVSKGSRTAPMQQELEETGVDPGEILGHGLDLAHGNFMRPGLAAVNNFMARARSMSPEKANALADVMLPNPNVSPFEQFRGMSNTGGSRVQDYMNMLMGAYGIPATEIGVNRLSPPENNVTE